MIRCDDVDRETIDIIRVENCQAVEHWGADTRATELCVASSESEPETVSSFRTSEPETGIEPATCCLQDSCSAELSYPGGMDRNVALNVARNRPDWLWMPVRLSEVGRGRVETLL